MSSLKRKRDDDEVGDKAKVVANHYNHVPEVGIVKRMDSRIFHMRNFNNWTKSMIIDETLKRIKENRNDWRCPITVLDIGCGKGGDLRKYKIGRIRHLICTDIAETSLSQAEDRYREMVSFSQNSGQNNRGGWNRGGYNNRGGQNNNRQPSLFSAEFIHADATKDRLKPKYRDPQIEIDMVSSQFSFHYCFESLPQVEQMLQNITENMVVGGYFIGTTPDSNEILRRAEEFRKFGKYSCPSKPCGQGDGEKKLVRKDEEDGDKKNNDGEDKEADEEEESVLSFGNDIYSITFKEGIIKPDEPPPLYGAEYNFHLEEVVDCPEFLVNFDCLVELAAKYGLQLVYKERFDHFYHRKRESRDGSQLLDRMQALEKYPAFHGANLGNAPDDYTHAQQELDKLKHQNGSNRGDERSGRIPIGQSIGTLSKSEWEVITLYLVFVFEKVGEVRVPDDREERESKKRKTNES